MRVYHRTHHAGAIERDGFHDGFYLMPGIGELRGVFVSADRPLDENEGADGDTVLELDVPVALFERHEHLEAGKTYREAMIPAADLNRYRATLRRLSEAEVEELTLARWDYWRRRLGL